MRPRFVAHLAVLWIAAATRAGDAPPFVRTLVPAVKVETLLTTGQEIPLTAGSGTFLFPGIPDGLGAWAPARDALVLFVNHEWPKSAGLSAGPLPSGARITALQLALHRGQAHVESGRYAIERVVGSENAVTAGSGFAKFCSGFLADARVGFNRPIYLCGEEERGAKTFDGRGGQAVALHDGTLYTLAGIGRAEWENVVVAPFTGLRTVAFALEDGPSAGSGLHSQLYIYIGEKRRGATDPLAANGLVGGSFRVFVADDPARRSEATFATRGERLRGHWVEMDPRLDDDGLDAAAEAAGAFDFVRIEDGAADPRVAGHFYFATTGKPGSANPRGRLYRLRFDPRRPLEHPSLEILLDGSEGVAAPDNLDANRHGEIAIQEDPGDLRDGGLDHDSSIWIFTPRTRRLVRVAEVDRDAARAWTLAAHPENESISKDDVPGGWETSGILDAEPWLGRGAWFFDVQAHSLRVHPAAVTVQGGQLLVLRTGH